MKIALIGASGTIGRAVAHELSQRHEIITVGKTQGQYQVDITRSDSIRGLFERIGKVDAIVSTASTLHFGPLAEMTAEQFKIGLHDKLLGQVDLALIGQHYLNPVSYTHLDVYKRQRSCAPPLAAQRSQHLVVVLAQRRRRAPQRGGLAVEAHRQAEGARGHAVRQFQRLHPAHVLDLRIRQHFGIGVDGRARHAGRAEPRLSLIHI